MSRAIQASDLKMGPALKVLALNECRSLERSLAAGKARHERIHEVRKSSRRLRSLLALFTELPNRRAVTLDKALRQLVHSFSALRDAHVAVRTAWLMATSQEALTPALVGALKRHSATLLGEALESDPGWRRRRVKVQGIVEAVEKLPWQLVSPSIAKGVVKQSTKRMKKARRVALEQRTVTDLHRWRRRARHLRYQLEFLRKARRMANMKKKRTQHYADQIKRLASMTDRLGWRQDFQVFLDALGHLPSSADARDLREALQKKSARLSKMSPSQP
jgi:CHAD domain-containing protein